MRKFTDGTATVPPELKPKYKSRKPEADLEDTEEAPLSALLGKRKAGGSQAPAPKTRRTGAIDALEEGGPQSEGSQAPQPERLRLALCMPVKAYAEAESQLQQQSGGSPVSKLLRPHKKGIANDGKERKVETPGIDRDYFARQLAGCLRTLESRGFKRGGLLWKRVEATYLSHPNGEIAERVRGAWR